jgi:hypothetical protein
MAWLREADRPFGMMQVACDPAGGQRDSSGLSFVERIILESLRLRERAYAQELEATTEAYRHALPQTNGATAPHLESALLETPKPKPVIPLYKDLYQRNRHDQRRLALRTLLTTALFAPTAGAERIRLAMRHYRFSEPGDKATSQPAPIHDQWSHIVTACEFLATFINLNVIGGEPRPTTSLGADIAHARRGSTFGGRVHA